MNLVTQNGKACGNKLPALVKKVSKVCEEVIPKGDAWPTFDVSAQIGLVTHSPAGMNHPNLRPYRIKITVDGKLGLWWGSAKTIAEEKKRRDKAGEPYEN